MGWPKVDQFKGIRREELPSSLAKIIPYVSLFVVVGLLAFTLVKGRPDLALMGSYALIAVVLVVVIAVRKPSLLKGVADSSPPRFKFISCHFSSSVLSFILLYIVSVCFLVASTSRLLPYFIIIALMAGLITIQIFSIEANQGNRKWIIIAEIVFLALNIIFGQTLKLPLFWGDIDSIAHMHWIELIASRGHIAPEMGPYQDFPLFHVIQAVGITLTNIEQRMSIFLLNGICFAASIPIVYLLVKQLTGSCHLPLLATLLYAVNRDVLLDVMPLLPRAMAFFICLLILYLLLRRRNNIRLTIISIALIIPVTLTHHITLVYMSGIYSIPTFLSHRV